MTQSFFSAIEKPALATIMSVAMAFVFPVLLLGGLWFLGLEGIWLNFAGVNFLGCILGVILLLRILKLIRKLEKEK